MTPRVIFLLCEKIALKMTSSEFIYFVQCVILKYIIFSLYITYVNDTNYSFPVMSSHGILRVAYI